MHEHRQLECHQNSFRRFEHRLDPFSANRFHRLSTRNFYKYFSKEECHDPYFLKLARELFQFQVRPLTRREVI
ncbi:unnamed protein product, partial [Nesidiocoris tenuis]